MPALLKADMEAINRYFMEQVTIKTPAAEVVKQEWMRWWEDHKRDWTWYTQEEFDHARNEKHKLDQANATTAAELKQVKLVQAKGMTSEEMRGETRRAGTTGEYVEPPKPLIPTKWKVGAGIAAGVVVAGVIAKKVMGFTPLGKLAKFL
jgi:hypothetical protein